MASHKLTDAALAAARVPVAMAARAVGVAIGGTKVVASLVRQAQQGEPHQADAPVASPPSESRTSDAGPPPVIPDPADLPPPVDVVEQVIRAEEEGLDGQGRSTEPKASSYADEHGGGAVDPAEVDQWDEEQAEALAAGTPAGAVDIETPVGTPAAEVGRNPDTAESDLQQPGTEPLMDPSLTKQVKAESKVGRRGANGGRRS